MELAIGLLLSVFFYALPAWLIWKDTKTPADEKTVWMLAACVFSWFGYIAFMLMGKGSD